MSLPSRKRGLKSGIHPGTMGGSQVASFAEAWIEIVLSDADYRPLLSRFLRGSVD